MPTIYQQGKEQENIEDTVSIKVMDGQCQFEPSLFFPNDAH